MKAGSHVHNGSTEADRPKEEDYLKIDGSLHSQDLPSSLQSNNNGAAAGPFPPGDQKSNLSAQVPYSDTVTKDSLALNTGEKNEEDVSPLAAPRSAPFVGSILASSLVSHDIALCLKKSQERKRPPVAPGSDRDSKRPVLDSQASCEFATGDSHVETEPPVIPELVYSGATAAVPSTPPTADCSVPEMTKSRQDSPSRTRCGNAFAKTVIVGAEDYELQMSVTVGSIGLAIKFDDKQPCFDRLDRKLDEGSPVLPEDGDRIVEIDGHPIASLSDDVICNLLKDHAGRSVRTIRLRKKKKPSMPQPIYNDGVAIIGENADRGLCVILPPDNRQVEIAMCREINEIYSRCAIHSKLREHGLRGKDDSIRSIQSKRFEVFIRDASNKGSAFWDRELELHKKKKRRRRGSMSLPDDTTDRILSYAIEQARRDPRIRDSNTEFKFGNFSLILSYGDVPAQAPHVDLLAPNYQFVLCLTDGSPSTYFYDMPEKDRIRSVQDLRRLWESIQESHEDPFPENLASILEKCPDFLALLNDFGDVFHPNSTFKKIKRCLDSVRVGTVLSLPGGVVHAGPATESFRAVLFFSAVPISCLAPVVAEYNPDTQFSSVLLAGFTLLISWRCIGMTKEARLYLLRRLAMYVRQADVKTGWDRHFHHEAKLREVVRKIAAIANPKKLDALLKKHAELADMIFYHVQTGDFRGDFACVSDTRLYTDWEGVPHNVVVFKRNDDEKVLLFYPADRSNDDVSMGWEGNKEDEKYILEMDDETALFNGENGTLISGEGEIIKCYIPEGNAV